jgi:cyclopropane fatty-acyl-phospholipid synthase-like methyltransferase
MNIDKLIDTFVEKLKIDSARFRHVRGKDMPTYLKTGEPERVHYVKKEDIHPLLKTIKPGRREYWQWNICNKDCKSWIDPLAATLPHKFPPSFYSFISRYAFPSFNLGPIRFCANTGEDIHYELAKAIFRDPGMSLFLLDNGFLQIGNPSDWNYDPVCFDCRNGLEEPPIVQIDHEGILTMCEIRIVERVSPSFPDFINNYLHYDFTQQLQLQRIRQAYDDTDATYHAGFDLFSVYFVPSAFLESSAYKVFKEASENNPSNSAATDNKVFLNPNKGMKFLDAGCCANLANYRLDRWDSTYYGVDLSPALIRSMRGFTEQEGIKVGGLEVAEIAELPFDDNFFDIASCIGVLEYFDIDYCQKALTELHRVLKPGARMMVDIPNMNHPHVETMMQLEEYLRRPNVPKERQQFEDILTPLFEIERSDDSRVMLKYFVVAL